MGNPSWFSEKGMIDTNKPKLFSMEIIFWVIVTIIVVTIAWHGITIQVGETDSSFWFKVYTYPVKRFFK